MKIDKPSLYKPGYPADNATGHFIGLDEGGRPFVLRRHPKEPMWVAIGFESDPQIIGEYRPVMIACHQDRAEFIKRHIAIEDLQ